MKNKVTYLLIPLFLTTQLFAQFKLNHLDGARIQTNLTDLKQFASEKHVVLFGKNETKPTAPQYVISISEIHTGKGGMHNFEPANKVNPSLFGMHISHYGFEIFEEVYAEKEKRYSIIRHTFFFDGQRFTNKKLFDATYDLKPKIPHFAKDPEGNFAAIYLFRVDSKGAQHATILDLSAEYLLKRSKDYTIKEKLNPDFKIQFQMSPSSEFIAVHEVIDAKNGNYLAVQYEATSEESTNETTLYPLFNEKNHKLLDFKIYLNDDSTIEFMAVTEKKVDRGIENNIHLKKFNPLKEKAVYNNFFPIKATGTLKLHSYLPINEHYSAIVLDIQNGKSTAPTTTPTPNVTTMSLSKNDAQTNSGQQENGLNLFYVQHEKGVIWQKAFPSDAKEIQPELTRLCPAALDSYFWSDGRYIYTLYYKGVSVTQPLPPNQIAVNPPTTKVLKPHVRMIPLNGESIKEVEISGDERSKSIYLMPSYTKIPSLDYLVSVVQMTPTLYYPVQIITKY